MSRYQRRYTAYIVAFGCAIGFGGSVLDLVQLPFVNFTLATPWVVTIISLNKLVLARPLSVTLMYAVAGVIAIITPYFGPPSILGILAVLAGLAFDLFSRFKTTDLTLLDLILGHLGSTIVGFPLVWLIFHVQFPDLAPALVEIFFIAAFWHFAIAIVASIVLFKAMPPNAPNNQVRSIRESITAQST